MVVGPQAELLILMEILRAQLTGGDCDGDKKADIRCVAGSSKYGLQAAVASILKGIEFAFIFASASPIDPWFDQTLLC